CVVTDGPLGSGDLTLEAASVLRHAAPWGQGFPEPLFDGRFEVLDQRIVGERHMKLRLKPHGSDRSVDAILFQYEQNGWDDGEGLLNIAYRMDVNAFRGNTDLQLVVERVLGRG
ncbi:MAG: single-stranded-DNA-specific exonuclease RecJ, partial [Pseudomonadota bacterium]|nr:single-stranded-DNA-specific exonuclease RecJ [Pseudomonadota bacterium]